MLKSALEMLLTSAVKLVDNPFKYEDFSNRIKNRHRTFWKDSNAESVRNTVMNANDLLLVV